MTLFYSFVFAGIICALGQVVLDNTSLNAGGVTSLFTAIGALLSFFNIYDLILDKCGIGARGLITNFGASLYKAGIEGYAKDGILGIFTNLLSKSSLVIVSAVLFAFLITLIFRPKD